jgi:hypothetical protein
VACLVFAATFGFSGVVNGGSATASLVAQPGKQILVAKETSHAVQAVKKRPAAASQTALPRYPQGGTKTVSFDGYAFKVPAPWPVYRVSADSTRCVRYDRSAVYLGTPGTNQQCPAHLVGQTATVSIAPSAGRGGAGSGAQPVARLQSAQVGGSQVRPALSVSATYGAQPAVVQQILHSVRNAATGAPVALHQAAAGPPVAVRGPSAPPAAPVQSPSARPAPVQPGAAPSAAAQSGPVRPRPVPETIKPEAPAPQPSKPAGKVPSKAVGEQPATAAGKAQSKPAGQQPGTAAGKAPSKPQPEPSSTSAGKAPSKPAGARPPAARPKPVRTASLTVRNVAAMPGFDTCTAPSVQAMRAWRKKFSAAAIYIGGVEMACGYGNLSASWVTAVRKMGWSLIPIYVGLQAPCNSFGQEIQPRHAASEGLRVALGAMRAARMFGLGKGTPIYFDMEAYNNADTVCRNSVLSFLSAWTKELHASGYVSGVYSSAASGAQDLGTAATVYGRPVAKPDSMWFALWDNQANLVGTPYLLNSWWNPDRRIKQYAGSHWVKVNGVTLNIDSDWVQGAVY